MLYFYEVLIMLFFVAFKAIHRPSRRRIVKNVWAFNPCLAPGTSPADRFACHQSDRLTRPRTNGASRMSQHFRHNGLEPPLDRARNTRLTWAVVWQSSQTSGSVIGDTSTVNGIVQQLIKRIKVGQVRQPFVERVCQFHRAGPPTIPRRLH